MNKPSRILTLADGGSLRALQKKGNLTHVENLYNPDNYFSAVHILVFDKNDLYVELKNPTLKVHYLRHFFAGKLGLILSLPYLIWQTVRIIKKYNIEMIRARNAYLAGCIGVLAGKWTKIPTIISLGGDNRIAQKLLGHYYGGSKFLSFHLEEFSLRRATRVICVNEFTKQYAIRLGVATDKIAIVPHRLDVSAIAYDGDFTETRRALNINHQPTIVIVGRLEKDKQIDVVIEAIPLVKNKFPQVNFIIIGDGSLRTTLTHRIAELRIQENVQLMGFKPRGEVINYLKAANIVCIPMSGFVIYEAAAAKKSIIAFDVEWHSEFIEHEKTGLLVTNRDEEQLANAIIKLLADPNFANKLGENAQKKLQDEYDAKRVIVKEINVYQDCLSC